MGLPPTGSVKINIDGAYMESSKGAGIGVVCRDAEGRFIGGMGKRVVADSALMVECMALLEALRIRGKFPDNSVIFETDCEVLYR